LEGVVGDGGGLSSKQKKKKDTEKRRRKKNHTSRALFHGFSTSITEAMREQRESLRKTPQEGALERCKRGVDLPTPFAVSTRERR